VHVSLSADDAASELPWLCAGRLDGLPANCPLGSNQERDVRERLPPRAIIFGAEISDAEVEQDVQANEAEGTTGLPPLRITRADIRRAGHMNVDALPGILEGRLEELAEADKARQCVEEGR
jgi:hypothetical protein